MIVWQGIGGLGFLLTVICMVITRGVVDSAAGTGDYFDKHGWPKTVWLCVSALLVFLLACYMDAQPSRVVIDKATGREITLRRPHTVFFIPLRFWAPILAVIGVLFLFTG